MRPAGFEPATYRSKVDCSTPGLVEGLGIPLSYERVWRKFGAAGGNRTPTPARERVNSPQLSPMSKLPPQSGSGEGERFSERSLPHSAFVIPVNCDGSEFVF